MARPKRNRRVLAYPSCWSFSPECPRAPETVILTLDEYETVRLIDFQKKTQMECAEEMGVSRATVAGIYESARHKIADAIVNAKRIRITGGAYRIDVVPASEELNERRDETMRIAVTYENGMIGQHFGRTEQFKIYDIRDGKVAGSQVVGTGGTAHSALAGFLRAAEVETLICGGIGMGARHALEELGIRLLPGLSGEADEVVASYLDGTLAYDPDAACAGHDHGEGGCHSHQGGCGSHGCH